MLQGWAGRSILLGCSGCPVVLETLIGGQASLFAVLIVSAVIVCWRRQKWVLAGAVLALACYKPNVLALFGMACVLYQPRLLRGAIPVALVLTLLCLVTVGLDGVASYAALGSQLAGGAWDIATPLWKVQSLTSWLELVAPGYAKPLAGLLGLLSVVGAVIVWRRFDCDQRRPQLLVLGLLLSINSLFNPYTPIYDLTLVVVAVLVTVQGISELSPKLWQTPGGQGLVYTALITLYFGPHLSQALAKLAGCQFFALGLVAIALWQARLVWRELSGHSPHELAVGPN